MSDVRSKTTRVLNKNNKCILNTGIIKVAKNIINKAVRILSDAEYFPRFAALYVNSFR
jgi:hypothetical protein